MPGATIAKSSEPLTTTGTTSRINSSESSWSVPNDERSRIRNNRPAITFNELSGLRWKCTTCDDWHSGPCLDFGFSEPHYWQQSYDKASRWSDLPQQNSRKPNDTFLDPDYCSIDGKDFFVRASSICPSSARPSHSAGACGGR
jgi:hypothetical protein